MNTRSSAVPTNVSVATTTIVAVDCGLLKNGPWVTVTIRSVGVGAGGGMNCGTFCEGIGLLV